MKCRNIEGYNGESFESWHYEEKAKSVQKDMAGEILLSPICPHAGKRD